MSNYWYPKHMYTDLSYGLTDALKLAGFDDSADGSAFTKCCQEMSIKPMLDYKYKCGIKEYDPINRNQNQLEYSEDASLNYDCSLEHNFCKTIRLVLDDGTSDLFSSSGDDNEANTPGIKIISSLNEGVDISVNNIFKFSNELLERALNNGFTEQLGYRDICNQLVFSDSGEDILDDSSTFNRSMKMSSVSNNCLISQGRKFKLFLDNGLLKLSFFENDCQYDPDNELYVGKNNGTGSASVYKIDDKTKHMGKLYHIDGQGSYREFLNPGYSKDSKQFKIIPRVSSNGATQLQVLNESTKTECENACIDSTSCQGYQFNTNTNVCTTFKNDSSMYPYDQTKKQIDANINTYVRVPYNINSTESGCVSKNVNNLTTNELEDYNYDSDPMNNDEDCGVSAAINENIEMTTSDGPNIDIIKDDLDAKREEILGYIKKLTTMEKKLLAKMGTNVINMERDLKQYKDIKEKKIEGREIDVADGQFDDSNKKLNKEMSFLVGTSIASIVLLLVAINLQKK